MAQQPVETTRSDGGADDILRVVALVCATIHHAAANLVEGALPANPSTVTRTAGVFYRYIKFGTIERTGPA